MGMSKHSRSGGKYTGNHTTLIPAASIVCDIAAACPSVTKITPGYIKAGLKSANGHRRVKITEKGNAIMLSVRDNASHQEVYVYASDVKSAKLAIAQGAKDKGLNVGFSSE